MLALMQGRAEGKRGHSGQFKDNFSYFSTKPFVVTPHTRTKWVRWFYFMEKYGKLPGSLAEGPGLN